MKPAPRATPRPVTFVGVAVISAAAACTNAAPAAPTCAAPAYDAITQVQVPWQLGDDARLGLDLDGDRKVDDAYARLERLIHVANADLSDPEPIVNRRLANRDVVWLVSVAPCDDGRAALALVRGADADGDGVPEVVGAPPAAYAEVEADGRLVATGGGADAPVTLLADPVGTFTPLAWRAGARAAWDVRIDPTSGALDGLVGFALRVPEADRDLAAPYAAYLSAELAAGTSSFAAAMDTDHDGVVSIDELLAQGLENALFGGDVRLDDGSGGLSFGVGVHAVPTAVE